MVTVKSAASARQPDELYGERAEHDDDAERGLVLAMLAVKLAGKRAGGVGFLRAQPRDEPRHARAIGVEIVGEESAQKFFFEADDWNVDSQEHHGEAGGDPPTARRDRETDGDEDGA